MPRNRDTDLTTYLPYRGIYTIPLVILKIIAHWIFSTVHFVETAHGCMVVDEHQYANYQQILRLGLYQVYHVSLGATLGKFLHFLLQDFEGYWRFQFISRVLKHRNVGLHTLFYIYQHGYRPCLYHQLAHTCHNSWCVWHTKVATPDENEQMKTCHWNNNNGVLTLICFCNSHTDNRTCFPPPTRIVSVFDKCHMIVLRVSHGATLG